ncbi:hypothetical protein TanjilG_02798 [Lupinus angustifolius]|uniref:VQ domain-containing protein n=1 Tax=Lupinus angustifolius TaxID=3871 RepID=A0A1J7IQJ8_LUPAN|nr:PREDICTED: uncharacterized protein LOC109338164 [Lupinus angustifolius]OIW16592.1 hypothetical protein TanjilG_02798 [Lupinus angustifolius]
MNSGNSRSISSSGDEEYDSRVDHTTLLTSTFPNHPSTPYAQSSFFQTHHHHHNPSLFDLSSSYFHSLSQSQPNTNPNSFLNLDTTTSTSQGKRSEPNCTHPTNLQGVNQCLFPPPHGQGHDDNNGRVISVSSSATTNNATAARNSKKRTRASRRAPTTVLTTDTSNFRAMVQEFTGIPAPPFSGSSSYSRRLDLLPVSSSSLRTSASHHLDTTPSFNPFRPLPQKHHHQQNPLPSTLLHSNNMVDAIASSSTNNNNNFINYQQPPPDLGLPYHHHSQNIMLTIQQNHPNILAFHQTPPHYPLGNHALSGFRAKSRTSLSVQSLEELGINHGQVNNADLVGNGVSVHQDHGHVSSNHENGDRRELNFSKASAASRSLNHEMTLDNNNRTSITRVEGNVDSWICSSD